MTGASFRELHFNFCIGKSTAKSVTDRTLDILWETFQPIHMGTVYEEYFENVAKNHFVNWGMPKCLGSIDVRHIPMKKPAKTGSRFRNWKGFNSMALQAVVDDNRRYLFIDIGGYGSQNDGGTFKASLFYKAIISKNLNIPAPSKLPGSMVQVPYFFLGDGAYPLKPYLLKPFPGKKRIERERNFNSVLSKSRVSVENAYGFSCQKFNILYTTINKSPNVVEKIVKGCCILHNIIIDSEKICFKNRKEDFSKENRLKKFNETLFSNEGFDVNIEEANDIRNTVADYLLELKKWKSANYVQN